MFKYAILITLLIVTTVLCAVPDYYPKTTIAENFSSSSVTECLDANTGLDIVHDSLHAGEFISARYYTESDELSNDDTEARFLFYNVNLTPTVIFDGITPVLGNGVGIIDGSVYYALTHPKINSASHVKIDVTGFNAVTRQVNVRVTMYSPTYALNNQTVKFLLLEDNVSTDATHVVRSVISQPITLTGANNFQDYNVTFPVNPTWNNENLRVAAYVQLNNRSIIQAASNLPQPQYLIRAVVPFNTTIIDSVNYNYVSQPMYFFNPGQAENYTIRLMQDSGPTDWYFNYCDENGICHSGDYLTPFTLNTGESIGFHLNLWIGSSGSGNFHFEIDSPNIEPYIIPFTYHTLDTANDDQYLSYTDLQLLQNYPNPFSNSTTLRVNAYKASQTVEINIFNIKGQKVNSIRAFNLSKGINNLEWKSTDQFGKQLSPGIYFAQIKGTETAQAKKLLILNK